MKKYIIYTLLNLILITATFANSAPIFLELEANQESYELGDRALLVAHVKINPVNPNYELFFKSRFDGSNLTIDKVSENELVSFTPVLDESGTFEWTVYIYMQDKFIAESLNLSKLQLIQDNIEIDQELVVETDQDIRELLTQMKARNNTIISEINSELNAGRRHLQTLKLNVVVNARIKIDKEIDPPIVLLTVELDRENYTYQVGEQINYVVTRIADLEGNETLEHVIRAKLNSWKLPLVDTSSEYIKTGQSFVLESSHVGERKLKVSLYIRPRAKADSLRAGILSTQAQRADYIKLKNDFQNDPIRQDFYELKIDRLGEVIENYYDILEYILDLVTTNESVVFINE